MMFKYPGFLWLLLILLPLIAWYIWKHRNANPSLGISTVGPVAKLPITWKVVAMHLAFGLQLVAIAGLIVALARPQTHDHLRTSKIEGTDIILALDISGSMSARDFKPTRFAAAKEVASKFVSQRTNDNMGLVVFAGESLSLMPLTNDRAALMNAIQQVEMGDLNDGTAIGDGLTSAINRIASGKAKSKSIILLTDGTNNAGDVPPSTAAQIAKQKGIKVYTIGVGTNGSIQITDPYGFSTTTMETKIDEQSLKQIASATGGKFFRAKDEKMLRQVFDEIDSLEKTVLDVDRFTTTDENFMPWVILALCAFGLYLLMRYTVLRRIP
ncbi:MAG: VWA domain-containing protein [Muribaculaceae bacterium]|nr:VWA domain-containing protein [Muribaculaceae bacterium]